jgi:hypothetical protein
VSALSSNSSPSKKTKEYPIPLQTLRNISGVVAHCYNPNTGSRGRLTSSKRFGLAEVEEAPPSTLRFPACSSAGETFPVHYNSRHAAGGRAPRPAGQDKGLSGGAAGRRFDGRSGGGWRRWCSSSLSSIVARSSSSRSTSYPWPLRAEPGAPQGTAPTGPAGAGRTWERGGGGGGGGGGAGSLGQGGRAGLGAAFEPAFPGRATPPPGPTTPGGPAPQALGRERRLFPWLGCRALGSGGPDGGALPSLVVGRPSRRRSLSLRVLYSLVSGPSAPRG